MTYGSILADQNGATIAFRVNPYKRVAPRKGGKMGTTNADDQTLVKGMNEGLTACPGESC